MYLISDGGMKCNILDTIESIMLTANNPIIDGVKLDVRKTIDNKYVVSKYDDLSKLTYSNKLVSYSKYNYLKKVKFKSLVFKYYIPTLEEILIKYDKNKIIVFELYNNNIYDLYSILSKYNYRYYFYSKDSNIINEVINSRLNNIGTIINIHNVITPKIKNIYSNSFLIM